MVAHALVGGTLLAETRGGAEIPPEPKINVDPRAEQNTPVSVDDDNMFEAAGSEFDSIETFGVSNSKRETLKKKDQKQHAEEIVIAISEAQKARIQDSDEDNVPQVDGPSDGRGRGKCPGSGKGRGKGRGKDRTQPEKSAAPGRTLRSNALKGSSGAELVSDERLTRSRSAQRQSLAYSKKTSAEQGHGLLQKSETSDEFDSSMEHIEPEKSENSTDNKLDIKTEGTSLFDTCPSVKKSAVPFFERTDSEDDPHTDEEALVIDCGSATPVRSAAEGIPPASPAPQSPQEAQLSGAQLKFMPLSPCADPSPTKTSQLQSKEVKIPAAENSGFREKYPKREDLAGK